jgi:hypothetical protein
VRRAALAAVALAALVGGCTIPGLEETATRQSWPADTTAAFGCTPVSIDLFGGRVRGSGSGVFVSDRWLLTAAHVVPEGAQFAWISTSEDRGSSGYVYPIEVVITGGGEPVEPGDWALIRLPERASEMGVEPARLMDALPGEGAAVLVGFPTVEGPGDWFSPREVVVLQSEAPGPVSFLGQGEGAELGYLRMVRGWSRLGGASGGPVVVRDAGGAPAVSGILLGRVEYRGLWRRGRAIVTHAVPAQAHLAALGLLDGLPSRLGPEAMLVWGQSEAGATLDEHGDGVPQRQAPPRR